MEKKSRILYVQRPPGGGSAISLYELLRNLDRTLFEPIALFHESNRYCEQFRQLGVKVIVMREQGSSPRALSLALPANSWLRSTTVYQLVRQIKQLLWQDWPLINQVVDIIKDESIDLIHHNNDLRSNRASVIAAKLTNRPQVCHIRWLHDYSVNPVQYWIDRYLAYSIDYFIYISKAVEESCHRLNIPSSKGEIVYNPFDLDKFNHNDTSIHQTRLQLGLTAQDKIISNIGRLTPWKGQDNFLQAIAKIIPDHPNVKILIVGAPDPIGRDLDYYEFLKQLVLHLELANHVIFTGFRDDIAQIIKASDVIVHSAIDPEPFGRIIVEAMACGRPVIATAAGGVTEIIEDHVTGILIPLNDIAQMAKSISELLYKQQLAIDLGRQAQMFVQTRFTVKRHVDVVQKIYEHVSGQR